jgi:hypothetical protein
MLVFLAIALPGFGAALAGIRDQRQYHNHPERASQTATRLALLKRQPETQIDLRAVQRLAKDTQALIEADTLDWTSAVEFHDSKWSHRDPYAPRTWSNEMRSGV